MNIDIKALKLQAEIAQAKYLEALNSVKEDKIKEIKAIMLDFDISIQDLGCNASSTTTKKTTASKPVPSGIYKDENGNEVVYIKAKGKKPSWFNKATLIKELSTEEEAEYKTKQI